MICTRLRLGAVGVGVRDSSKCRSLYNSTNCVFRCWFCLLFVCLFLLFGCCFVVVVVVVGYGVLLFVFLFLSLFFIVAVIENVISADVIVPSFSEVP